MKKITAILFALLFILSCSEKTEPPKNDASSIFVLNSKWQNQDGKEVLLNDLEGKNVVMAMIFTSCKTACPLLVADMQKIHSKMDKSRLKDTQFVLVSIDPDNDTPAVLKDFAAKNGMASEEWLFLRSDKESVRELANVVAVKYKKISLIVFSHSNIITVFNKNGQMAGQVEGTVNANEVAEILNAL